MLRRIQRALIVVAPLTAFALCPLDAQDCSRFIDILDSRASLRRCLSGGGWSTYDLNRLLNSSSTFRADSVMIGMLVAEGADPNWRDEEGRTALAEALDSYVNLLWSEPGLGLEHVRALLAAGADPTVIEAPLALLFEALRYKDSLDVTDLNRTVVALLRRGVDPNAAASDYGNTPLAMAVELFSSPALTETLVKAGADPNAMGIGLNAIGYGWGWNRGTRAPVVMIAAYHQSSAAVIRSLLDAGADPTAVSSDGRTVLHYAMRGAAAPGVVSTLLVAGADPNARDPEVLDFTPLHWAAARASADDDPRIASASILLRGGADPNIPSTDGRTPLHFASNPSLVRLLLAAGADPNITDRSGVDAIQSAALAGDSTKVAILIEAGVELPPLHTAIALADSLAVGELMMSEVTNDLVDLDLRDYAGFTALQLAVLISSPDMVKSLVEAGANVDLTDNQGYTALHHAIRRDGPLAVVETLVDAGANLEIPTEDGSTGLQLAVERGDLPKVTVLLRGGADPHRVDENGNTTLHIAARFANPEVVQAMLDAGVDPGTRNNQGELPVDLAENNSRIKDTDIYWVLYLAKGEPVSSRVGIQRRNISSVGDRPPRSTTEDP